VQLSQKAQAWSSHAEVSGLLGGKSMD